MASLGQMIVDFVDEVGGLLSTLIDVAFDVDEGTPACIWVYEASARDGSSIHVGQIPVTLSP